MLQFGIHGDLAKRDLAIEKAKNVFVVFSKMTISVTIGTSQILSTQNCWV